MLTPEQRAAIARLSKDQTIAMLKLIREFKERLAASVLPQSAVEAMNAAVPTAVIQDIVDDSRKGLAPRSMAETPEPEAWRRTGFVEASPLRPPPGVVQCDRLVDAQDEMDRAQRRIDAEIRSKLK
jgi:hypothetical protein